MFKDGNKQKEEERWFFCTIARNEDTPFIKIGHSTT